jgi:hypothetical protein
MAMSACFGVSRPTTFFTVSRYFCGGAGGNSLFRRRSLAKYSAGISISAVQHLTLWITFIGLPLPPAAAAFSPPPSSAGLAGQQSA